MFPERMVCLAAEIPAILDRLGALDRVVGISAYTQYPEAALRLPKVSGFKSGNLERILGLKPDLAILTSDVQKELAARLSDAGVYTLHLQPHRLEDLFKTIALLGNLVGEPHKAAQLTAELRQEMEEIRLQAERLPWHPRVYFEEWMDPLICGTGWVSDLIELAGGRDVFRTLSVEGRKASDRVIRPEDIRDAAPDLVLASWCGKPFDREQFTGRDGFPGIPAITRDAVYEIDGQILQCGPMLIGCLKHLHRLIKEHAQRFGRNS
jgi:iron complex transport system substrate-binding protein